MARRLVAVGVVVVAAVVVPAGLAAAKTTVDVKGDAVTITVPIDCAGCQGKTGPDGTPLADYWGRTATKAWNDAFAAYSYCGRYKFALQLKIRAEGSDFKGKSGDDLIQVIAASTDALRGTGWEGAPERTPGGIPGQRTHDGTRYYQNDADGFVASNATPTVIDHEVGHLLGLGDDRDTNGNALPGRDGTLMVGGANGVTPDSPLTIDQALIDRIGKQLENLGKIDKCKQQTWHGTLHVDETAGRAPQAGPCMESYTADVALAVQRKQTMGTATIRPGGSNSCGPPARSVTVALSAHRSVSGFEIETGPFTPTAPATARVKDSGRNLAHGTVTTMQPGLPPGRQVTYDVTIDLQCTNCGKPTG